METLHAFKNELAAATTNDGAKAFMTRETVRLGFEQFAYVQLTKPQGSKVQRYIGTYDEVWSAHYREKDLHIVDRLWGHSFHTHSPFLWSDIQQRDLPEARKRIAGPAGEVGLCFGIGIPTHDVIGTPASVHMAVRSDEKAVHHILNTRLST